MSNADVVSGFQFTMSDTPNNIAFSSVSGSDRIPADWQVSGNDADGSTILLGFSFQGTTIAPGDGAIATVTVDSDGGDFSSELCFDDYVLSNPQAEEYFSFASCTDFVHPFEEPMSPIVLDASGEDQLIHLEWTMNQFSHVENSDEITLGYRTNNENIDSIKVYQHRPNQGILVDGKPLKNAFFHNKDQNSSYYMYLKEFRADHTLDGQGYNSDVRDVVVDIFLGIELFYKRGNLIIREEFPYKKTIFTRSAAAYNLSKEYDSE